MMKTDMDGIIKRIKDRRLELGYSFQDLAEKTNMSKSTLQRYETGAIKNVPLDRLEVLAKALDVTPAYLMGWEENEENHAGGNIRYYREKANLSLEELSRQSGIDIETLKEAEKPNSKPDYPTLYAIAKVFKVSPFLFLNSSEIKDKIKQAHFYFLQNKFNSIGSSLAYDENHEKYIVSTEQGFLLINDEQLEYFDEATNQFLKFLIQDFCSKNSDLLHPYPETSVDSD